MPDTVALYSSDSLSLTFYIFSPPLSLSLSLYFPLSLLSFFLYFFLHKWVSFSNFLLFCLPLSLFLCKPQKYCPIILLHSPSHTRSGLGPGIGPGILKTPAQFLPWGSITSQMMIILRKITKLDMPTRLIWTSPSAPVTYTLTLSYISLTHYYLSFILPSFCFYWYISCISPSPSQPVSVRFLYFSIWLSLWEHKTVSSSFC